MTIDLSHFTTEELETELKRRRGEEQNAREARLKAFIAQCEQFPGIDYTEQSLEDAFKRSTAKSLERESLYIAQSCVQTGYDLAVLLRTEENLNRFLELSEDDRRYVFASRDISLGLPSTMGYVYDYARQLLRGK